MAVQGIELPISLQIKNLQDIASQIKQFASKNVLADSLGGKKLDQELSKVLSRLEQISAKSKTAFTTQGDFSSIQKDINALEIGFNRIQAATKSLKFEDLQIPDDAQSKIEGLNARIRELQNNLISFKGTQKEKIISDQGFLTNLNTVAGPKEAAKMLQMEYDELYKTINNGMTRVNTLLEMKAAAYRDAQEVVTQNSSGKTAMTQWGAVNFLQEAFKSLPKDDSKQTDIQKLMQTYMNYSTNEKGIQQFSGFAGGAAGESRFLKLVRTQFELTPQQTQEMLKRMEEQAEQLHQSMTQIWQKFGTDKEFAANMAFGPQRTDIELSKNKYLSDLKVQAQAEQEYRSYQNQSDAYAAMSRSFDLPSADIKAKAEEIGAALQLPQRELEALKNSLLSAAQSSPEFAAQLSKAGTEISKLGTSIDAGKAKLAQMDQTLNKMQGIQNFINRYIGIYAIVRRVTSFMRNAISNVKELDKNITNIAVVTNMSQKDLWGKIGEYTNMAQQFGVATKDVYTVSQLFYQQGLQTSQVLSLTTETLKMAKISGMGFSDAANAMTVAVRAFNIDMQDAQQVTDTYSALAAKFAVSSAEIANAMEKTASSASNVGMSLQSTSAFISVMEQTTREGAQNIGSALKSIISRYGEMKASPNTLLNTDGEEVSFNKVDTALKSVGISIKDSSGQFRDFDDVIMELSKKWDTLDNNTQRYIATVMAGNRQQSRFIALVSNYDELNRAMNTASNSENASIVQTAKTMDSLESKTNQLKNAFSQLYLDIHIEDSLKDAYSVLTRIVTTIGKMSKGPLGIFGGLVPSLLNVVNAGMGMKNLIGMGKDWYQKRRNTIQQKVEADTKEAETKVDDLVKKAEQTRIMHIRTEVDSTALNAEEVRMRMLQNPAQTMGFVRNLSGATNGEYSQSTIYNDLKTSAAIGALTTSDQRDAFLGKYGIQQGSKEYEQLSPQLSALAGQLQTFGIAVTNAAQQVQAAGTMTQSSSDQSAQSDQKESTSSETAAGSLDKLGAAADAAAGKMTQQATMPPASTMATPGATPVVTGNQLQASDPRVMAIAARMQALNPSNGKTQDQYADAIAKKVNNGEFMSNTAGKKFVTEETGAKIDSSSISIGKDLAALSAAINQATANITAAAQKNQTPTLTPTPAASTQIPSTSNNNTLISPSDSRVLALAQSMAKSDTGADVDRYASLIAGKINSGEGFTKRSGREFVRDETEGFDNNTVKELGSALSELSNSVLTASENIQQLGTAAADDAGKVDMHGSAVTGDTAAVQGATIAASGAQQADQDKVPSAQAAKSADDEKAMAGRIAAQTDRQKAVSGGTPKTGEQTPEKTGGKFVTEGKGIGGKTFTSTGFSSLTIATSLARMVAPLITAAGAAKEDKSSDNIEGSKMITAAGNGVSLGATGAQMGAMLGPYGAIIGGLAGLAIGFLPGFFDAIDYTVTEKYNNAKKELEEAEKNSQQKQAKVLDLRSAIDDIKTLRKSMYDSEEDMAKYKEAMSNLGNQYPELISAYDESGNAIVDLIKAEQALVNARKESAQADYSTAQAKVNAANYAETIKSSVAWQAGQVVAGKANKESTGKAIEKILTDNKDNSEMFGGITKVGQLIGVNKEAKELSDEEWQQVKNLLYDKWTASLGEKANAETAEKTAKSRKNLTEAISTTTRLSTDSKTQLESNEAFMKLYTTYEKKANKDAANKYIEFFRGLTSTQRDKLGGLDYTKFTHMDQLLNYLDLDYLKPTDALYQTIQSELNEANEAAISRITHIAYEYDEKGKRTSRLNADMKGLKKLNYTDEFGNAESNRAKDVANLFLGQGDEDNRIIGEYSDYFSDQLVAINKIAEDGNVSLAKARIDLLYRLGLQIESMDDEAQSGIYEIVSQIDFSNANSIIEGRKALQTYASKHNLGTDLDETINILNDAQNTLVFNVHTLTEDVIAEVGKIASEMQKIAAMSKSGIDLGDAITELTKLQTVLDNSTLSFDDIFTYDVALKKYVYTAQGLQDAIEAQELKLKQNIETTEATDKVWREQILDETGQQVRLASKGSIDTSYATSTGEINLHTIKGIQRQMIYGHGSKMVGDALWDDDIMTAQHSRSELESILKDNWGLDLSAYGISETLDEIETKGNVSLSAFRDSYLNSHKNGQYGYTSEIMQDVKTLLGAEDEDLYKFYEDLATEFLKSEEEQYSSKDWNAYIQFLEQKAKDNTAEGNRAREALKAYQNNIINTMFSAIDWSKIFLGTDLNNTQLNNIEAIAERMKLGSFKEDSETGELIFEWADQKIRTATESANYVIEEYLNQQYGEEDSAAKQAARSSIKGQTIAAEGQAVSTAIEGILKGAGNSLDETSAILAANAGIEFDNNGLLKAGENYVNAALDLYNANIEHLTTVAERNSEMTKILNKAFEQNQAVLTALNSGAKMDLNTLETTLTAFGIDYNETVNQDALRNGDWANLWKGSIFEGILKTDEFGNTQIGDWNDFVAGLKGNGVDVASLTGTYEYRNAYSTYVDGMIESDKQLQVLAKKIYDNAFSSIADFTHINVSEMRAFDYVGLTLNNAAVIQDGFLVIKDSVQYAKNALDMFANLSLLSPEDLYQQTGWTTADLAKNWKAARTVITQASDTWLGISDALTNITDDTISQLTEKGGFKLTDLNKFTKVGNHYVLALSEYEKYLQQNLDTIDPNAVRQMKAAIAKAQKTITDLLLNIDWEHLLNKSYSSSSALLEANEAITNAATSLGIDASKYIDMGKYTVTGKNGLLNAIKEINYEIGYQLEQKLTETVASLRDAALGELDTSLEYMTTGTTKQSDMNSFLVRYNELVDETQKATSIDELFRYDELTQKFILTDEAINNYIQGQKAFLKEIGMTEVAVESYIENKVQELVTAELDIQSFVTSADISSNTKEAQSLMRSIKQWGMITGKIQASGKTADDWINEQMNNLIHGGTAAVNALIAIKGKNNVTDEEVQEVYRAEITRLQNIMEKMDISAGSILTGTAAEMFKIAEQLDYKNYRSHYEGGVLVIDAVRNMTTMYRLIYDEMKHSAEATQQELNSQYAKVLTARDQGNIDAIEALNNAMGMDYETFGALISKNGIGRYADLEYVMANAADLGIETLYNGQIRINDFEKLASKMRWQVGSEAYTEAYKAYNDSIIELDRKTAKAINEEVKSVLEAKAGDKINVTWLSSIVDEEVINSLLEKYHGQITNGILTLENNADIVGITETLGAAAKQAGEMLPEEMAALEDAVKDYISKMTDAITKGIKGTLTTEESHSLETWAKSQGIIGETESLQFTETTEGLKLSTRQAILLYQEIKKIDSIQGEIAFKELSDSLQKSNDNYKDMASIIAHINELRVLKDTADPTKKKQYEAELEVAERIARVRATAEDSSFDFMNNKIPGGQNNPLKYFKSWGTAWSTMTEAFKGKGQDKGLVDYEDWYNIATEMGHLAGLGADIEIDGIKLDGSLTTTSQLIQHGIDALTTSSTGEIKVNLAQLGLDFSTGAEGLKTDINKGVQNIAKSQVAMLDSMIAMLEVIVAMEQLGDLDTNLDMSIGVDELLEGFTSEGMGQLDEAQEYIKKFGDKYTSICQTILSMFANSSDPKMQAALQQVKVNGHTIEQILQANEEQLKSWGISAKELSTLLTGFYKMTSSDLWDPDDVWGSFEKIFSGLDLGDMTISVNAGEHSIVLSDAGTYSISLDSSEAQANMKKALETKATQWHSVEQLQATAQDALYALESGQDITIEQDYALRIATGEVIIEQQNGEIKYRVGKQAFNSWEDAAAAADLARIGATNFETIEFDDSTLVQGTLTLGQIELTVQSQGDGKPKYVLPDGQTTENKDTAIQYYYEKNVLNGSLLDSNDEVSLQKFHIWKLNMGIEVEPAITITGNGESITTAVQQQVQEKLAKGTEGIQEIINMAPDFGIKVRANIDANNITVDELNQLTAAFGVESQVITVDANFTVSGSTNVAAAIESGQAQIEITPISNSAYIVDTTANVTSFTQGVGPLANPNNLVNHLTARVIELSKKENLNPAEKLELQTLKGQINELTSTVEDPADALKLKALSAMATLALLDNKSAEDYLKLSNLTGYVTLKLKKDAGEKLSPDDEAKLGAYTVLAGLTVKKIENPNDWTPEDELNLNNLTAFINAINTTGADKAIEEWKAALEQSGITIPINTSGDTTPPVANPPIQGKTLNNIYGTEGYAGSDWQEAYKEKHKGYSNEEIINDRKSTNQLTDESDKTDALSHGHPYDSNAPKPETDNPLVPRSNLTDTTDNTEDIITQLYHNMTGQGYTMFYQYDGEDYTPGYYEVGGGFGDDYEWIPDSTTYHETSYQVDFKNAINKVLKDNEELLKANGIDIEKAKEMLLQKYEKLGQAAKEDPGNSQYTLGNPIYSKHEPVDTSDKPVTKAFYDREVAGRFLAEEAYNNPDFTLDAYKGQVYKDLRAEVATEQAEKDGQTTTFGYFQEHYAEFALQDLASQLTSLPEFTEEAYNKTVSTWRENLLPWAQQSWDLGMYDEQFKNLYEKPVELEDEEVIANETNATTENTSAIQENTQIMQESNESDNAAIESEPSVPVSQESPTEQTSEEPVRLKSADNPLNGYRLDMTRSEIESALGTLKATKEKLEARQKYLNEDVLNYYGGDGSLENHAYKAGLLNNASGMTHDGIRYSGGEVRRMAVELEKEWAAIPGRLAYIDQMIESLEAKYPTAPSHHLPTLETEWELRQTNLNNLAKILEGAEYSPLTFQNLVNEWFNTIPDWMQAEWSVGLSSEDTYAERTYMTTAANQLAKAIQGLELNSDEYNTALEQWKASVPEWISSQFDQSNSTFMQYFNTAVASLTPAQIPVDQQHITDQVNSAVQNAGASVNVNVTVTSESEGNGGASGTLGLAKAKGTLMGELGPELVVSNGNYFVVGQNGPEMVNLADDAIVFNHLQTKSLLEKGTSSSRGRAITNERNAVSYAKGNIHGGPAMGGGAEAALASLKELRAMWSKLAEMSVEDFASKGGGGGGGGGGKNDAFIKNLERWYDLLQQIAQLEKDITYEQSLRSRIASDYHKDGYKYYDSQRRSLQDLQKELNAQNELYESQSEYFEERRAQMNSASNPFTALYTFNEEGQLQYKEGAYKLLTELSSRDELTGKPNHTIEEQYEQLIAWGYGDYMKYDNSGKEIDTKDEAGKKSAIQAFWDKIEADKQEMQEIHNSIEDSKKTIEDKQKERNELLKEIEDNQISVENRVLAAIEDAAQREIDEMQDEKDAIQASNENLINGLSKALEREKTIYNNQQTEDDTTKLQRQLAILQRSGGSAAEIKSLQDQINSKTKDLYFAKQQEQIDALQDASDAQLEKLQQQIDIANETLEYQKKYGLLWEQVYEVMAKSPEEITNFITEQDSSFWGKSEASFGQEVRQIQFETEQWAAFTTQEAGIANIEDLITKIAQEMGALKKKEEEEKKEGTSLDADVLEGKSGSGGGNGNGTGGKKDSGSKKHYEVLGQKFTTEEEALAYLQQVQGKAGTFAENVSSTVSSLPLVGSMLAPFGEVAKNGITGVANAISITEVEAKVDPSKSGYESDDKQHWKRTVYTDGMVEYGQKEDHKFNKSTHKCSVCGKVQPIKSWKVQGKGTSQTKTFTDQTNAEVYARSIGSTAVPQYYQGGMDYQTGLAMLHGTSTKPEAVLNAEQTKVLRENILSNRPNSLISLLQSYNDAYQGMSTLYNSNSNNASIVFEHAEVNVKVDKLANDYDAARAGDSIMREMLNIARKTSASNRIGG